MFENNLIITMGVFKFTSYNDNETTKVTFTFILKSNNERLMVKAHHSSLISI